MVGSGNRLFCWPNLGALSLICVLTLTGSEAWADDVEEQLEKIAEVLPECPADVDYCFGIALHVVVTDDGPVQTTEWFSDQFEIANKHFALAGVAFELASIEALDDSKAIIETKKQRDKLGRADFSHGPVHIYVVQTLMNVDEPGEIYGVHWRDRNDRSQRWIILSSIAWGFTMGHELGHFFGCRHSDYPISIMNKTPRSEPPVDERTFADQEVKKIKKKAKKMVKKKQLEKR